MITIETKLGDMVTNHYGETGTVVGESSGGGWWIVRNVISGRETFCHKVTLHTVAIVGIPIEGGN
jgi:hypothetical protein